MADENLNPTNQPTTLEESKKNQKEKNDAWEKMVNHVKSEMEDNRFTEKIIEAVQLSKELLESKIKVVNFKKIITFLETEELDVPEDYRNKQSDYEVKITELEPKIPEKIAIAFEDLTQRRLLQLISYYKPSDDRKDEEISELEKRLQRQTFRYIVSLFTNEQKEKVYEILHSAEIKDWHERTSAKDFEEVIGYSINFARKNILKDVPEELEPFIDFCDKYMDSYNSSIAESISWFIEFEDANLNDKRINDRANKVLGRLGFKKGKDKNEEEKLKQMGEELLSFMKNYFPNYTPSETA